MTATRRLELDAVTKSYGRVRALTETSLALDFGAAHCLAGPNGSGKTTLLRLIAGLTRPTSGRVIVPDVSVGYAFQRPNVYPDLTVRENLSVFAAMVDAREAWRAELTERLRLDPVLDRPAAALSDGFAKKLDLAVAMLKEPSLLLLDEPLADLDDVTRTRLLELLAEYRDEDRLLVVSTHNVERFDPLLDGITVVYNGEVVRDDRNLAEPAHAAYADVLARRG